MELKPLLIAALVALSLGLAACGSGGSDSTSSEAETAPPASEETSGEETESTESEPAPSGEASKSEKVDIVEFTYQPDPVVVGVGGKVIWQNQDTAPHTATADDGSFDTGTIEKGKIGSETFKEAGTFTYFCEIHPTMHGTVEVVE
ncbi:MAG TPA: plastocyanin/azurin family copper-binding protein [Solirubrobacterales bacterium]|jgi:plastocyanin|nr:plastocyanin/azurin family copper-binding protein [Solirubrobacterales bacterium]